MNDLQTAPAASAGALASDIDPRFETGASGVPDNLGASKPATGSKPAQQQLEEMATACNAWVREKPMQALGVAAGLGFLLGRLGR